MTILTIRKHQRFAVRRQVRIARDGARSCQGLLVELSLDGCRLSLVGSGDFAIDQPVSVRINDFGAIKAKVRWAGDGFVGLRFDAALHNAELSLLLQACRPRIDNSPPLRAYAS